MQFLAPILSRLSPIELNLKHCFQSAQNSILQTSFKPMFAPPFRTRREEVKLADTSKTTLSPSAVAPISGRRGLYEHRIILTIKRG